MILKYFFVLQHQYNNYKIFQAHLMGISRIFVLTHEWETYYKDEFRKAARLAREVSISIEPIFFNEDPRFTTNTYDRNIDKEFYPDQNPFETDEYDPTDSATLSIVWRSRQEF